MKKIFFLFTLLILSACVQEQLITNFKECKAAGNPIMESYPRQCRANGQTFVEEVEPIGGQRDEHGCLGPAGYSFSEEIGCCVRIWELNEATTRAAKIAVEHVGKSYGLTVDKIDVFKCPGCFMVHFNNPEYKPFEVELSNWEID
jgi:hypothetical protein